MPYQAQPGDGTLFKNKDAKTEKHPSHSGSITAHRDIKKGERVRLAAWTKGGQDGKDKFLSLKMSDERGGQDSAPQSDPF
jgi:hypothetical protein